MNTTANTMNPVTVDLLARVAEARQMLHDTKTVLVAAEAALLDAQATGDRDAISDARDDLGQAQVAHARVEAGWFQAVESILVEAPTAATAHVATA